VQTEWQLIGTAEFATGERFSVYKFHKSLGCMVVNLRTGDKTRASTPDKAWSAVRYLARIGHNTEHTPGIIQVDYDKMMRELARAGR
jgi:hypothetical protein